jgi:hypothetical protein
MRINNIRVPHLGQDGQAITWGENLISVILRLQHYLAYLRTNIFLAGGPVIDTLTFTFR